MPRASKQRNQRAARHVDRVSLPTASVDEIPTSQNHFQDALKLLLAVKENYCPDQQYVYEGFLNAFKGRVTLNESAIMNRVVNLFYDKPHLIESYKSFIAADVELQRQRAAVALNGDSQDSDIDHVTNDHRTNRVASQSKPGIPDSDMTQRGDHYMKYIWKVQERFDADPSFHPKFVEICLSNPETAFLIPDAQAIQRLAVLFREYNASDLIPELMEFMPPEATIQP